MSFPVHDSQWLEAGAVLKHYARPLQAILAPNEFLDYFPGTYPYTVTHCLPVSQFDWIVLHKGMLAEIDAHFLRQMLELARPIFANSVFLVFASRPPARLPLLEESELQPLLEYLNAEPSQETDSAPQLTPKQVGMVVVTRDRPDFLARSLPQIAALGAPVVVVDDGSQPDAHSRNAQLAAQHQAHLIYLPAPQGTPSAINVGVGYWLGHPEIEWLSYFQDDVDVHPDLLTVLFQVQDARQRPLLTGRDAIEHEALQTCAIANYQIQLKRASSGQHFHGHRRYWQGVLPIPTPQLSDRDRQTGRGTEEDWWISAWAPRSVVKQGQFVVCVPGLVRQFEDAKSDDWGGIHVAPSDEPIISDADWLEKTVNSLQLEPAVQVFPALAIANEVSATTERGNLPHTDSSFRLDSLKVLIDGYNLQLTTGTGIKTYGLSLMKALKQMGASVDVLLSRNASKANPILDEVLFFDNQINPRSFVLDLLDVSKGLAKTSLGPLYQAKRRKQPSNFVVKQGKYSDEFLQYAQSFNLPRCYDVANVLYKKLRFTSNLYVSEKMDVWHATYPLPITIRGAKKITTIHDLIPLRLPYATLDDKENFYYKIEDAIKDSDVIIAVSEHSKSDLLDFFEIDPDRIVVTYQPIALEPEKLEQYALETVLRRFGLADQNYILFVGAIEPKKNVGRLLDAYSSLDTHMPLVIAGKKGWLWEDELNKAGFIGDEKSTKKVKFLEYVPVKTLSALYQGAYCFVFPSLYEGFGLPPIEAMTLGCPVITSNVSCLPEVCANAALYVDPYDVSDIKQQLERLLSSPELRNQLIDMGYENAAYFSMENYVKRLHYAYTQAMS